LSRRSFTPKSRLLRQEHYRWMREGVPNFDDRIFEHVKELEIIAKRDVKGVSLTAPVMKALEEMSSSYRALVVQSSGVFQGLVTTMSAVNYLGGGELFNIVARRHNYDLYSALYNEPVESITVKNPVVIYVDEGIKEALVRMVVYGAGILPVLNYDETVYGILTEHDLLKYLSGLASSGLKVKDYMSSPVVTIESGASIKKAMETMVKYGFRRLPVVEDDSVVGLVTSIDIVRAFGTHQLFEKATSRDIREIISVPVDEVMVTNVATIKPEDDIAQAASTMLSKNVSSLLVVDDEGVLQGIITERDVLYSILAPK